MVRARNVSGLWPIRARSQAVSRQPEVLSGFEKARVPPSGSPRPLPPTLVQKDGCQRETEHAGLRAPRCGQPGNNVATRAAPRDGHRSRFAM